MAESGMVGADTSIYNKLMQPQPQNDLGHLVGIANAAQQNQLLQAKVPLEINNAQLENSAKHLDYVNNYLAPLIALGPKVGINDLTKAASDAAANSGGAISQQEANNFVQQIVTNPNGIQPALQQMHMRVLDAQGKIQAIRGNTITNNDGRGTSYLQQNSFTGGLAPAQGGYIPNRLTPQDKVGGQATFQNGQAGTRNVGATFDDFGNMRPVAPSPGQTPATSMAPAGMGTPPAPVAAAPAASAFNPTQAPIGVQESETKSALGGVERANDLELASGQSPDRKSTLNNISQLLDTVNTGPFGGKAATLGAAINQGLKSLGSEKRIPGVGDAEDFMAQVGKLQGQQAQALGGTDAAKILAGSMKPSMAFSPEGNRQIVATLKGNEDAINAKNMAWQDWKKTHGANTFGAFEAQFNQNFDPRAFQFPYMNTAERQKILKDLKTDDQRAEFMHKLEHAEQRGWIKPSGNF